VWGAGQVRCFDPAGEQVATVEVAAPHTSSVAFVGPERDRLLITTAREDLTDDQLTTWPLSGRLFLADVGARGVPTVAWSGRGADIT
jgi:sugar lactone lactonase YvrE